MFKKFIFVFSLIFCSNAFAKVIDYTKMFEVNLEEEIPPLEELRVKYSKPDNLYDRKYDYHWNIGEVFDAVFRSTISSYGSSSKRISSSDEKNLQKILEVIPKEYYQYIGPYLHTVPGIPEKILSMPGIKETKNKFPEVVAKEVEDIEGIEFLSPYLYFLLMPEAWSDYRDPSEKPKFNRIRSIDTKITSNPDFYEKIKTMLPEENYLPGADVKIPVESRLRTINITKESPLTTADIKAFSSTLSDVQKWGDENFRILNIAEAGIFLEEWEKDNGKDLPMQTFISMVNPCQRLAQKIRLAGLEDEFLPLIVKKGFNLNTWAYTCDKTIKAYRVATIPWYMVPTIMNYQRGLYERETENYGDENAQRYYAHMQALIEMYKAPMSDVLEVRNDKDDLRLKIINLEDALIDSPIVIN